MKLPAAYYFCNVGYRPTKKKKKKKRAVTFVHIDVFILTVLNETPGDTFSALQRSTEE